MSKVAIARANPQDVSPAVMRVLELSECTSRFTPGLKVVVKPNLITDNPDYIARGANTSIPVLESLLGLLAASAGVSKKTISCARVVTVGGK